MRIILLGGPGAGKGTQATNLTVEFNIPHISTGDMLRTAVRLKSEIGIAAKDIMDAGDLVSDDIMISLIQERLTHDDCKDGYLLDGFPRTLAQAEAMRTHNIDVDYVIEIDVADSEIINRLSGRRSHPGSGRTYHIEYNRPKIDGEDDVTGEPLIQRKDDNPQTIRNRLNLYHSQTMALIKYYSNDEVWFGNAPSYLTIKGVGSVAEITKNILKRLNNKT